jgi:pimeloyl-ACP methyl ester carboxylesterase
MTTSQTNLKREIASDEMTGKQCWVQEIPVHYVERGNGIPLLALHGAYSAYQEVASFLEPIFEKPSDYRRIYVDLPGMGRTPAPETVRGDKEVLEILLGFIDAVIGDEPFLVVGHSYGGYLARAIANRRPSQVIGMALLCPLMAMGENAGQQVPQHQVLYQTDDGTTTLGAKEAAEFQTYFVVQTPEMVERYQQAVAPSAALADTDALERMSGALDLNPEAGNSYPHPSFIVVGRQDSTVGYADQWQLLEHYPRATFAVLDRAGHALPHEQPELLRALMQEWLARVAEA